MTNPLAGIGSHNRAGSTSALTPLGNTGNARIMHAMSAKNQRNVFPIADKSLAFQWGGRPWGYPQQQYGYPQQAYNYPQQHYGYAHQAHVHQPYQHWRQDGYDQQHHGYSHSRRRHHRPVEPRHTAPQAHYHSNRFGFFRHMPAAPAPEEKHVNWGSEVSRQERHKLTRSKSARELRKQQTADEVFNFSNLRFATRQRGSKPTLHFSSGSRHGRLREQGEDGYQRQKIRNGSKQFFFPSRDAQEAFLADVPRKSSLNKHMSAMRRHGGTSTPTAGYNHVEVHFKRDKSKARHPSLGKVVSDRRLERLREQAPGLYRSKSYR
ncbi:hypothetical protein [Agarilytica rhodophyticola]|uniref:hypothetical protein n=1 Tax=Agarilytica rhodophyticola TaxID=1737490 RepID=UPI00131524A1|nr:hypothetical protein [Agarilytica rhodophyticola]